VRIRSDVRTPSIGPACLLGLAALAAADTVQIPVGTLLNARPVTTLTGGALIAWTEGLDGPYSGEATASAARRMGDAVPKALPDDGFFPATSRHPEVRLHFDNADGTGKQVRRSMEADTFSFAVPPGRYRRLMVFCMSANGASSLSARIDYSDGSEERALSVPDWFNPVAESDPNRFNLASDLAKWDQANRKTEPDHHYLHGLELNPMATRTLNRVRIAKTRAGVLTFWGATGIREESPSGLLLPGSGAGRSSEGESGGVPLIGSRDGRTVDGLGRYSSEVGNPPIRVLPFPNRF
jgi:hypothetical protein